MPWDSRKASAASSYWKLWRAVTPRRKAGCAAGAPEFGKRMVDERSARSANRPTGGMLARVLPFVLVPERVGDSDDHARITPAIPRSGGGSRSRGLPGARGGPRRE